MAMTAQAVSFAAWRPVVTLIVASAVIMGSPGPSTMSVTAVGAAYGFRRSLVYASGLIAGTTGVLLAVAAGVVAILVSIPHGAPVLTGISAIYILYLAVRIATAPPLAGADAAAAAPAFGGGFLLAIANPKAYLAIGAVFAGNSLFPGAPVPDAAAKLALLTLMIVLIHLAWLVVGATLSRALHHPVGARILNVALAVSLVVFTAIAILG
jgi:threonine/homoserine/homoserine lactone efflux protein